MVARFGKKMLAIPALLVFGTSPVSGEEGELIALAGQVDGSFDQVAMDGLSVDVNGREMPVGPDGSFAASSSVEPYYRITISGASIHDAIQTFGFEELYRRDCDCLRVPPLGVVARKPGRIELFFAGDAIAGRRYIEPIWGERQLIDPADPLPGMVRLLEPIKPYVESADFASVNLESVLSTKDFGNSPPKTVTFFSPPELAEALAQAGFDYVTLGNNHSYDYLEPGIETTIAAVEQAGLSWSGAGLDEVQALRAARLEVGGAPLSMLGYVGWKGNVTPNQVAEAAKGGAAYGSDENIIASVGREAAAGRLPIVQYHGSSEYSARPSEDSERRMKMAIDSGAALVASHHPHVAHGLEFYKAGLIAYSMGNFLFDQYFPETHAAFALRTWMEDGRVIRAEVIPLHILEYRPVPAVGSIREALLDRVTRLSAERGTVVGRNGGHGLLVPGNSDIAAPVGAKIRVCKASGQDLLRIGDFENMTFGGARDRSIKSYGASVDFPFLGIGGHVLQLVPEATGQEMSISVSTFLRKGSAAGLTLCGQVWSPGPIEIALAVQIRPDGSGRLEALEDTPIEQVSDWISIPVGHWTEFAVKGSELALDANALFRPFLKIRASGQGTLDNAVSIDRLEFVSRRNAD